MAEFDVHADSITQEGRRMPEFYLWLRVTVEVLFALQNCGKQDSARAWIEDRDNFLFDFVADELGYRPDALRKRIREALERSRTLKRNRDKEGH
ncbi:MAG: hypothetical protein ABSE05_15455 [Syntrophales bacterium]|jgi:hypothetical protein